MTENLEFEQMAKKLDQLFNDANDTKNKLMILKGEGMKLIDEMEERFPEHMEATNAVAGAFVSIFEFHNK